MEEPDSPPICFLDLKYYGCEEDCDHEWRQVKDEGLLMKYFNFCIKCGARDE